MTAGANEIQPRVATFRQPVVTVGLSMIALQLCMRGWALSRSWFYTDDYLRLQEALGARLGWDYLMSPENGHLMPATRGIYFVFAHGFGLDWTAAAALGLLFQAGASLAALWMLVCVFGARWGVLPPLALYLTSAMTAQASLWWISALNQTPVQMCFFLAVGFWVRHLRSRGLLPLLGVLVSLVWGLLFFQKTLYVLPLLVVLALAYFATGGLVRRLVTVLRRYWLAWLALGVLAGGFTAYFLASVPTGSGATDPAWGPLGRNMVDTFVAGISGGPWTWTDRPGGAWADPPQWFRVVAWSIVTLTIVASMLMRRRAGRAWLLLAVYYVLLVGTIGFTRAAVFGAEIGTAYRLQTDGLCAAVLAISLAWLPLLGAVESSEPRAVPLRVPKSRWLAPGVVAALVLVTSASGTVSWVRYVDSWRRINDSREFVERLAAESDRLTGIDVVDREVPGSVLDDFTRPHNRLSDIADLIAPGLRFPLQSGRLTVVTDRGTINQALIDQDARTRPGPVADCGWSVEHDTRREVPLRAEVPFGSKWIRVGYYIQDSGRVTLELGGQRVRAPVGNGPNSLYVKAPGNLDGIRFSGLTSRGALCVNVIEVGRPVAGPQL